jgi:parallel beta-helix repeat protein
MSERKYPLRQKTLGLVGSAAIVLAIGVAPVAAQEQSTITVDTTSDVVDFGGEQTVADLPGPDGQTSLREAAIASTNTAGPETIVFDIPTTDPGFDGAGFTIRILAVSEDDQLMIGDDGTTIDATTQPGGHTITVEGPGLAPFRRGLWITSSGNAVIGLGVRSYGTGIQVDGGSDNLLVGVGATDNNNGITFAGRSTGGGNRVSGSTISDNGLGVAITNTADIVVDDNTIVGNDRRGVFVLNGDAVSVTDNLIADSGSFGIEHVGGSGGAVAGNTITGGGSVGILVTGGVFTDGFTFTRNSIFDNGGLGINLVGGKEDANGVTRNDPKDSDTGGNGLMNYPERLTATDDGTATVVDGRITFPDPQSVTVELFVSDAPDPSGFGEAQTFQATATPDAKGRFTATLPSGLAGRWLTATATDSAGNTSEFSEAALVGVPR